MLCPLVSLSLASALAAAAPAPDRSVNYRLAPVIDHEAIVGLLVTARFRGDASGRTVFDWPDGWAGEQHLGQWARDIAISGATAVRPAPHGGRVIEAAAGAPITVTYRIVSAFAADPTSSDSEQPRPVIRPTWFYAVGEALFAVPEGRDDAPASFAWEPSPGIGFASDLEHPRARPEAAGKTVGDITESIVIGGRDLRVTSVEAGGAPLRFASIGRYEFPVPTLEAIAAKVIAAERSFWRNRDHQPFLVTMAPIAPDAMHMSYSGTGRSDAFALWMDPRASLSSLTWLLAHEYFHTWNARQLGALGDGEAEKQRYWLSEGFTDFYARRLMLRAGLLTPDEFVANWNEALAAYAVSPFRTATNTATAAQFWSNEAAGKLPYQRGAMLAALWDARQRAAGRDGIDAILRDQRQRAARVRALPPVTDLFVDTAARHELDVRPDITRYLDRGELLTLPVDTFGDCARAETLTRPVFARGWDIDATEKAGNVVSALDRASPAYAAGLRDGMTILRRVAGTPGDARVPYVLAVKADGREQTIRFLPTGHGTETLQQIMLDRAAFARAPRACTAALSG